MVNYAWGVHHCNLRELWNAKLIPQHHNLHLKESHAWSPFSSSDCPFSYWGQVPLPQLPPIRHLWHIFHITGSALTKRWNYMCYYFTSQTNLLQRVKYASKFVYKTCRFCGGFVFRFRIKENSFGVCISPCIRTYSLLTIPSVVHCYQWSV